MLIFAIYATILFFFMMLIFSPCQPYARHAAIDARHMLARHAYDFHAASLRRAYALLLLILPLTYGAMPCHADSLDDTPPAPPAAAITPCCCYAMPIRCTARAAPPCCRHYAEILLLLAATGIIMICYMLMIHATRCRRARYAAAMPCRQRHYALFAISHIIDTP